MARPPSSHPAGLGSARLGLALVVLTVAFNAVFLAPELRIGRVNLNDNVFHLAASERLGESLGRGGPFFDPWVSEWSLGYPVWRSYQPLPHLLAATVLRIAAPFADHATAFAALMYALFVLLPVSVYGGARLLGLRPVAAGLASVLVLAPSGAGEFGRYGLGFNATTWRGTGLYTQLVALFFLTPALGLVARALDTGRRKAPASVLLALTALSHLIFGYVAFVSAGLLALVGRQGERSRRLVRLAAVVLPSLLLLAWFVVPLVQVSEWVNHSRWEADYKWDSFGAGVILPELLSGRLLDAGRFPALSILALVGALAALISIRKDVPRRLLALAALWLLLFLGRAMWGHLVLLAGVPANLHMHRLQAAFELALVLLTAWGLEDTVRRSLRFRRPFGLTALTAAAALLVVIGVDRASYLGENANWGEENLQAFEGERADLDAALAEVRAILAERPGRVSAGPAASWGRDFKIGSVPVYAFLTRAHIDQVSFLYHSMSLTSEVMVLRDEDDPAHHVALGIRAFIAPADRAMPSSVRLRGTFGRFAVYEASPEGYFGLVDVGARYLGPPETTYELNSKWLKSSLPARNVVVALDPGAPDLDGLPAVERGRRLRVPDRVPTTPRGNIRAETKDGERYRAALELVRPCYAFAKITWFPGITAVVDGRPAPAIRVTPGFVAVPVPEGEHQVEVGYEPGRLKPLLLLGGLLAFALTIVGLQAAAAKRTEERLSAWLAGVGSRLATPKAAAALALFLFAVLALRPLFRGRLVDGHDAAGYPPRLVEFEKVVGDGQLPPIWAPDLGNGYGQPLFQFAPPLVYATSLPFRAAGAGLADSLQLALALLHLLGAAAVYGLGRRFGCSQEASVASAVAWLFAPYLSLDLFVRAAFAEASAVAVAPLALLGVLRATDRPSPGRIALGAAAVAPVVLAHNAVSLLLLPALSIVVLVSGLSGDRRMARLGSGAGAIAGGLGLSAYFWLPALLETNFVKTDLLRESFLHWSRHAVSLGQLLWAPWGFGFSVAGTRDGMSFAVGPIHLLLAGAGIACVLRSARSLRFRVEAVAWMGIALAGAFLATTWAAPFWSRIETLQYLAYPWRALFLPGLFLPLLAVFAFDALGPDLRRVALLMLVLVNLPHAAVKGYLTFDDEHYSPANIARQGINTTTREEYEPRWVEERPPHSERKLLGRFEIRDQSLRTSRQEFEIQADAPAVAEAATFFYPGWTAEIDEKPVTIEPVPVRGTMSFPLPKGEHRVALRLRPTPVRNLGLLCTVFTLLLVTLGIGLDALGRISRRRSARQMVASEDG